MARSGSPKGWPSSAPQTKVAQSRSKFGRRVGQIRKKAGAKLGRARSKSGRVWPKLAEFCPMAENEVAEELLATLSPKLLPAIPASSEVAPKWPNQNGRKVSSNLSRTCSGRRVGPNSSEMSRFGPEVGQTWPKLTRAGQCSTSNRTLPANQVECAQYSRNRSISANCA